MSIPTQPKHFLPGVFAESGTYKIIPAEQDTSGRASFSSGFPEETQQPLASGGVAPSRADFNGILHMLSALGFWQQSGGLFSYKAHLNYAVPSIVYHASKLWWCEAANGPDVAVTGVVEPGANELCWTEFTCKFDGTPVGYIGLYAGLNAPSGYLALDGSAFSPTAYPKLYAVLGSNILPDYRGLFARGYNPAGTVDPDGASRGILSKQGDAIRNITGSFGSGVESYGQYDTGSASGVFYKNGFWWNNVTPRSVDSNDARQYSFDASRVVPTSTENRPKNFCALWCIKHD